MKSRIKKGYFYLVLVVLPFLVSPRKHPVHGRYTRHIQDYELSVPHKLTFTGDFVSFEIPHFYEPKHEESRTKRSPRDPDAIHLGVHAGDKLHHIMLWPNYALASPDLVIEIRDPEALKTTNVFSLPDEKLCYYTGEIQGERNSRAALATCDGLVGYITIGNERFFIEPLEEHEPNEQGHHLHVVYKRDTPEEFDDFDILFNGKDIDNERKCRANNKDIENTVFEAITHKELTKRSDNNSLDGQRYIETMVVCDKIFLEYHRDLNRERFILTVVNMAADYLHDVSIGQQIDLVLVRLLYLEKEEKELDLNITHNAKKTLESFCKWQQKFNPPEGNPAHADISLLFTRLDICYGKDCEVVGQSFIGTPCKKDKNCAYCEDNGLELGLVVAHQIGHLLGAFDDHPQTSGCPSDDPTDKTPYIMSPKTNLSAIRWSQCTKNNVEKVISHGLADCLLDRPPPAPYITKPVLPGVIYDWASQCQLKVPGATTCPTQESGAILCEELRCLKPTEGKENEKLECFSVGKPPADGTKCDENMWCFQGKCIKTGKRPETIDGDWSEWGDWSDCTRSCGRGVSYALRKCNNPQPANGGRYCDGDKIRYKICHPYECPENATSFRQRQCDAYNDVSDGEGKKHIYKAFLNPEAPCALWCTNEEGENEELDTVVKDGTRCKPGTKNVCVNSACWKVGCDNMLNSAALEDVCGTCNGDGTGCKIIQETFKDIGDKDYYTVATFPTGAKKVKIEELAPSQNVIAITDKTEKVFYLNGKYMEQPDGVYKFGKVEGVYMHTAPNQEKLTIKGPLKQDIVFKVLFLKRENVGYQYQYAEVTSAAVEESKFHWEVGEMSDCSTKCGGGTQIARLRCFEQNAGLVSDTFCIEQEKPVQPTQHCNMQPCATKWRTGKWGTCDACKGKPGVQKRGVECVQENPNPVGEAILIEDDRCPDPAPGTTKVCSSESPCKGKRYVHYIPHSHLGDVWIKMQPKHIKSVHKREENSDSVTTLSSKATTETIETIDMGEFDISGTKSTLPLVCATATGTAVKLEPDSDIGTSTTSDKVILPKTNVQSIINSFTEGVNATNSDVKVPTEGYVMDKQAGNDSKLFIYPLRKTQEARNKNVTFDDTKDLPDTQLEDLEEDKTKVKKYTAKEAEKLFKKLVLKGKSNQEAGQKKNSVNPTTKVSLNHNFTTHNFT